MHRTCHIPTPIRHSIEHWENVIYEIRRRRATPWEARSVSKNALWAIEIRFGWKGISNRCRSGVDPEPQSPLCVTAPRWTIAVHRSTPKLSGIENRPFLPA